MDVALSIIAGLGLRLFLALSTNSGPSNKLTTAVLGLWEGIILHQLSGRSTNANLDHVLAYGLRVSVDLLVSKNPQRMVMVLLWSALGTVASEAVVPHADLRATVKKERERQRERRHKHSRSVSGTVPILSTPYPPRIRAYRPPNHDSTEPSGNPTLPTDPPPQSSTPLFPTDRPPTPPSFFLQENTISSPSPKPVLLQVHPVSDPSSHALPVRPRSGLATTLDRSSDSGSPLPVPNHLPTPPDSAVPSDGLIDPTNETRHETNAPRFEHQLYTIPELSSPEDNDTPPRADDHASNDSFVPQGQNVDNLHETYPPEFETAEIPLPVPNSEIRHLPHNTVIEWLSSQSTKLDPGTIFTKPFPADPSDNPNPLPVLLRPQDSFWDIPTPTNPTQFVLEETRNVNGMPEDIYQAVDESDSDELLTPGARRKLDVETDNENDGDLLRTPKQLRQDDGELQLSPLSLNVRSALGPSSGSEPAPLAAFDHETQPAPEVEEEDLAIPGSLSQNPLLHPPLPPSGSFLPAAVPPPESPPPPSPSTIHSDPSDISVLSNFLPNKQYKRGEELRQKARQEESVRSQLETDRRRAEQEGRVMDALALKIKIRELDAEAYKLHEKAARRFFTGEYFRFVYGKKSLCFLLTMAQFFNLPQPAILSLRLTKSMFMGFDLVKPSIEWREQSSKPAKKNGQWFVSSSGRDYILSIRGPL